MEVRLRGSPTPNPKPNPNPNPNPKPNPNPNPNLGDALGLPFVPHVRARARRTLRVLRAYGRACEHWLLGPLLVSAHRWTLRLLQIVRGEETFPMLCPAFPAS